MPVFKRENLFFVALAGGVRRLEQPMRGLNVVNFCVKMMALSFVALSFVSGDVPYFS